MKLHAFLKLVLFTASIGSLGAQDAATSAVATADTSASDSATVSEIVNPSIETSIIRVNVTAQGFNFYQPWEKGSTGTRRGLGVLLEGGKVLVSAQLVADSTYLELELPESGEKATAELSVVDYEANLALVQLQDPESDFLKGFAPMMLDTSPNIGDELEIWQVKDNGTPIKTTCPIVEIKTTNYFLESTRFLAYELKGSLQYQAGSFVLPVAHKNQLAGLLLSYDSDEQISRILPAPIIEHFLKDLDDGKYDGFPTLGMAYARTTDEQLRKFLKIGKGDGGVYISKIIPGSTADKSGLKVGDVVLELGSYKIDSRGNYDDPTYGKVSLSHLVRGARNIGEEIPIKISRDGEIIELKGTMTRKQPTDYLVDPYMFDRGPNFYIAGGIVFQELAKPYLQIFGDKWRSRAPMRLLRALTNPDEFEEKGNKKVVFLSRVIRTPVTVGYESISHVIVEKVNGEEIHSLQDLADAFQVPEGPLHRIELSDSPHENLSRCRHDHSDERPHEGSLSHSQFTAHRIVSSSCIMARLAKDISPKTHFRGYAIPGPTVPGNSSKDPALAIHEGESLDVLCGHFRIFQLRKGHRYSTDDILTAWYGTSWCPSARTILDLGSGIGTVAMVAAWRLPGARVVTVEAQAESIHLAHKSVRWNGLEERFDIREGDLRDPLVLSSSERFDLVLGSPPYFPLGTGVEGDHPQKVACRFEVRGTIADYCQTAATHLEIGGTFACVFPVNPEEQAQRVVEAAKAAKLTIVRQRTITLRESEPPLLGVFVMMRLQDLPEAMHDQTWHEPTLIIRREDGTIHPEYAAVKLGFGFPP